jgi:hypothetical protein
MRQLRNVVRWTLHPYRNLIRRLFLGFSPETLEIKDAMIVRIEAEQMDLDRELRTLQAAVSVYQRRPYIPRHHGGS